MLYAIGTNNNNMEMIESDWKVHAEFATWLVKRTSPEVIVDLGVGPGVSTFTLAAECPGRIYGIDWFKDECSKYESARDLRATLALNNKVRLIKGTFESVVKVWHHPIDILHIDGQATYEGVNHDYMTWNAFVKPNGVVLMHNTSSEPGIGRVFDEIFRPKVNIPVGNGLGVITDDTDLLQEILTLWL